MGFIKFELKMEEEKAEALIEKIDCGELWIFKGASGSEDFAGFIDKLYYEENDKYGTFCSCIFNGCLRIITAFSEDMPLDLADEITELIIKARNTHNSFTNIWYYPENDNLEHLLFNMLPWQARGHKTYELRYLVDANYPSYIMPSNIKVIKYVSEYLDQAVTMLDKALAHTFSNPDEGIYEKNKELLRKRWETEECFIMLKDKELVGMYILKDTEIDIMAIDTAHQNRGLGKLLLSHARDYIFKTKNKEPYLYCISSNSKALNFYLRENMTITGYSGYACLEKIL
jgi:GNAT superfamily N-acetyltransferase